MPIHTLAFSGVKTDSTANEAAPAVTDAGWSIQQTNRIQAPKNLRVLWATIMNDTITRARINAPSLRNLGLPEIYPVTVSDDPATSPLIADWISYGPQVKANENFGIDSSNGASTVDRVHSLLTVTDGLLPVPSGPKLTIFGTSTQTLVLDAWTTGTITLDQDLPPGQYACVGFQVVCNDAYGARLVFSGQQNWRPGCACPMAVGQVDQRELFRHGRFGELGRFMNNLIPQLDIIGNAAGAETANVILDCVQLTGLAM